MKVRAAAAIAILALASCATPPEKIKPIAASDASYSGLSCQQLTSVYVRTRADLETNASVQSRTASEDTTGVVLLGLPTGSMMQGNVKETEARIGKLKGEMIAIESVMRAKGCTK